MVDINQSIWSQTDANNNSALTLPGWPEGMNPSVVDDSARAMMGAIKRWYSRMGPTVTSTGSANAQVITYPTAPTGIVLGDIYVFIPQFTNTGSCTLTVNNFGPFNVTCAGGFLAGGELQAFKIVAVCMDGVGAFDILWTSGALPTQMGGSGTTSFSIGAIPFAAHGVGGSTVLGQDPNNLFYNGALGIGTNSPLGALHVQSDSTNALLIGDTARNAFLAIAGANNPNTSVCSIRFDTGGNLVLNAKNGAGLFFNQDVSASTNVNGTINAGGFNTSGNLNVSGSIFGSGNANINGTFFVGGTSNLTGGVNLGVTNATSLNTGTLVANLINTVGTINTSQGFYLSGNPFAIRGAPYNILYDFNGDASIYLGGGADFENYYRSVRHRFQYVNGAQEFAYLDSSGYNSALAVNCAALTTGGSINASGGINVSGSAGFGSPATFFSDVRVNGLIDNYGNISVQSPASYTINRSLSALGLNPVGVGGNPAVFLNDGANRTCILMGHSNVPQNYYFQQEHHIQDAGGASEYLLLRASDGLTTAYGITAAFFHQGSDANLKENISATASTIDHLRSLHPVDFNWRNDEPLQHGLIAQDVLKTPFASLVRESKRTRAGMMPHERGAGQEDTVLVMNYMGLIGPIIKAIQEIADRLDALEAPPPKKGKK